jgi:LysM repeat protein
MKILQTQRYNFGMKIFRLLPALLILTSSLLLPNQVDARPAHFSPNLTAAELIAAVNEFRATKDLPPYKTNSILTTIAQAQADYIVHNGVMTHFNASGTPPYQRAIKAGYAVAGDLSKGGNFSENIGSGSGLTASDIIITWQENDKDLQTLISTDLVDVGAGMAMAGGVTYYVLDAGASAVDSKTPQTPPTKTPLPGTQPVVITTSTPLEDGTVYHIVQANEALWSIAQSYNTTIDNIRLLNHIIGNDIFEGQKLLIRKPKPVDTVTPTALPTATFGIPTSTATQPVTPSATNTATPVPVPPASRQSGGIAVGVIVLAALVAAGIGSWLGKKKNKLDAQREDQDIVQPNTGAKNDREQQAE